MQARLITFSKSGQPKEFPVLNGPVVIGRQTDADLRIPYNEISRAHCQVQLSNGKLTIRDLKSSNGTFVNDQKVLEATLKPGDVIRIGPVSFVVQIDGVPKNVQAPAAKPAAAPAAAKAGADVRTSTGGPATPKKPAPAAAPADDFDIDLGSGQEEAMDLDDLSDLDIDDFDDTDESDEPIDAADLEEIDENDLIEDDEK